MAPICSDPRQIVIAYNSARRQALLKLIGEITAYMLSQLESSLDDLGPVTLEDDTPENDDQATERDETPKHITRQSTRNERSQPQSKGKPSAQSKRIQQAALEHMMEWRKGFMPRLEEIIRVEDSPQIQDERKKRREAIEKKALDTPDEGEDLLTFDDAKPKISDDVSSLQSLYHAIPTRLTNIPLQDRKEALSCVLLLILSTGKYSAHSRAFALYLASALELTQSFVNNEETEIAQSLMESSTADDGKKEAMNAEAEAAKRQQENKFSRFWKVGLASVAGATIIGVTGGLAAPLVAGAIGGIMGGVGLGGVASFLGIFWMNGALVGALFGAYGAKMTGEMVDHYAKEVEDFRFLPLNEDWGKEYTQDDKKGGADRRLRVTIGINGWLNSEDDIKKPWRVLGNDTEVFALRYEMKTLLALGSALQDLVKSFAWQAFKSEIITRTVLATLWAALWPIQVIALASNVDNPFGRANNRSRKAGRLLADALINKVQGERPVTLVGYSLGSSAIHACLQELAERKAFGLVDTVVIIGTPAPSTAAHWRTLRTVVSGKIYNVYSENDMLLGFVYRMHSLEFGVAGLQAVESVEGIENLDLSDRVSGHMRYPGLVGEILRSCGFIGVQAGGEIEKDDVIKMKDDHAEGKLVDFDGSSAAKKPSTGPPEWQPRPANRKQTSEELLRGVTVSPIDGPDSGKMSLPPRPDEIDTVGNKPRGVNPDDLDMSKMSLPPKPSEVNSDDEGRPALPQRRPTAPQESSPALPQRRPTGEGSPALPQRRPTAPQGGAGPDLPRRPTEKAWEEPQSSWMDSQRRGSFHSDTDDEGRVTISMVDNDSD